MAHVSQEVASEALELYRIPPGLIRAAVRNAERKEVVQFRSGREHLYLKRMASGPGCFLFVRTGVQKGKESVSEVLPIPADLVGDKATPHEAFQNLCNHYAFRFRAGRFEGRLLSGVLESELRGPKGEKMHFEVLEKWEEREPARTPETFTIIVEKVPQGLIEVHWAYMINIDKLQAALGIDSS